MSRRFDDPTADALCGWGRCTLPVQLGQGICRTHMLKAWTQIELEREALGALPLDFILRGAERSPQTIAERRLEWVYYVRLKHGDIKIGYTHNIARRLVGLRLPADALLAAEPGDIHLEKMRHAQFKHLRLGRTEDFDPADDLMRHIAMIAEHFGQPGTGDTP